MAGANARSHILNLLILYLQAATLFGEIPSQVVLLSAYIELMSGE